MIPARVDPPRACQTDQVGLVEESCLLLRGGRSGARLQSQASGQRHYTSITEDRLDGIFLTDNVLPQLRVHIRDCGAYSQRGSRCPRRDRSCVVGGDERYGNRARTPTTKEGGHTINLGLEGKASLIIGLSEGLGKICAAELAADETTSTT